MTLRTQIEGVLEYADQVDQLWQEVLAETGETRCPPPKAWEADDDARREVASAATAVLRELLAMVDEDGDLEKALRPAAPTLIVMACPSGEEEYVVEYSSTYGPRYDSAVYLVPGEVFTVCPACSRVNAGVTEVDRAERWNDGVFNPTRSNSLSGSVNLAVHSGGQGNYETDHFRCSVCRSRLTLPDWVEVDWS